MSSKIALHDAEKLLQDFNLFGLVPISQNWTPQLLLSLYRNIKSSPSTALFPPDGFQSTTIYIPVSYVQLPFEDPPENWSTTVYSVLENLYQDSGCVYGVWFDKMGRFQTSNLQVFWSVIANLHYAIRPVVHVTPRIQIHDPYTRIDASRYFPVCGLTVNVHTILCDWFEHHVSCEICTKLFTSLMQELGFDAMKHVLPASNWAHPGAYFRAWPMVERSLGIYNQGTLSTIEDVAGITCSAFALHALCKTAKEARGKKVNLINGNMVCSIYECFQSKNIAKKLPEAFEEVISDMGNILAADAMKIQPVNGKSDDKWMIAKVLGGLFSSNKGHLQPIFAYELMKKVDIQRKKEEMLDLRFARQSIISGWAGRAPCYAEADKIETIVLFGHFSLSVKCVEEVKEKWKAELVRRLYKKKWGLMKIESDVSTDFLPFENYSLEVASIGAHGIELNKRCLFGKFSGCIRFEAYEELLKEVDLIDNYEELIWIERCWWKHCSEYDGEVYLIRNEYFVDSENSRKYLKLKKCPRCDEKGFSKIGIIFRNKTGKIGKRRFWAIGFKCMKDGTIKRDDKLSIVDGDLILCSGYLKMGVHFSSKCANCVTDVEVKRLRGWPMPIDEEYMAIFLPDAKIRIKPPSRLSNISIL